MEKDLGSLDWTHVQSFLAVAETGSLSAAARKLGVSQPTLGRHIRALEQTLEAELFYRQPRGLTLTETAAAFLAPAQRMQEAASEMALAAAGKGRRLEGTVRLTASVVVAHHVLPPIIAKMRADEPRIAIELVASDDSENLLFREADIAIRMFRPRQLDLITRHLGDMALGVFASCAYLDRAGRPQTMDQALTHQFVGFDRNDLIIQGLRAQGYDIDREFFGTRCDMQSAYWELVRAGCGIGFAQKHTALADPAVEEILPDVVIPPLEVWLATHGAMRQNPRQRWVWDRLVAGLLPLLS